jgi:hypothetical protein
MSRRKRAMDFNVKSTVKDALRRLKLDAKMKGYAVWGVWIKAVGETVAQQAQPAFVRGGTLFVNCSASAWMQQLQFMKGSIRDALNRLLGNEAIKDIRFQIGEIARPTRIEPAPEEREVVLDQAELKRIEEALRPLADPEMREIARRIMVKEAVTNKTGPRKIK